MKRMLCRMAVTTAIALSLAACGGSDSYDNSTSPVATTPPVTTAPPVTTTPPPNSITPVLSAYDSFVAYVQTMVASLRDTSEPADVTAYDPAPVSNTLEPVATL